MARWSYDANISFNASHSPYWTYVGSHYFYYKGIKCPIMHNLRGSLLQEEVGSINDYLKSFKDLWTKTWCIIMLDGWSDGKNLTLINVLASFPQGTMVLRWIDAYDRVKDENFLFQLLDEIVVEVGVTNVVHIITYNSSKYVISSKMIESKCKTIFWTHVSHIA